MRIILNQIAKVSHAEIEINGITVLAGPNGTGKSTVCKSLYAATQLATIGSRLVACERVRSVFDVLRPILERMGARLWIPPVSFLIEETWLAEFLDRDFWAAPENLIKWIGDASHFRIRNFIEFSHDADLVAKELTELFPEISRAAFEILQKDEQYYADYVSRQLFGAAFSDQLIPLFGASDSMSVSLKSGSASVHIPYSKDDGLHVQGIGRMPSVSSFYLEPQHKFDQLWNFPRMMRDADAYRHFAHQSLSCIRSKAPMFSSAEDEASYQKLMEALKELIDVIHGKIEKSDGTLGFVEEVGAQKVVVALSNVASGAKTMSLLVAALEKRALRPGGLLIIDEPESNLHPAWQIAFARFLVSIVKMFDIRILLSTHSPYFMRAIQKYAQAVGIADRNKFYTMGADADAEDRKTAVADLASFSYHSDDVSANVESLFADLCAPLESVL